MEQNFFFSGIQQIGVGCMDMMQSWKWYIDMFGIDVKILEDDTVAERMLPYTGNKPQKRHACIAISLQGGGGFEIWQYSERKPQPIGFQIQVADLGLYCAKLKCRDVAAFHKELAAKYDKLGEVTQTPDGTPCFYLEDPWGNYFQAIEDKSIYIDRGRLTGGMIGAQIGVSNIEKSLEVYRDILGYDEMVYDRIGKFDDLRYMRGGDQQYRRVLLSCSEKRQGAFSELMGESTIELVQALDREPRKIYEGRYWGDPGFIQLCLDVTNMKGLKELCEKKGYPFTCDSCPTEADRFDMGEASGHFTYIEDPDGYLIEFVETRKIPIAKKLNWYLDLTKRDVRKPLAKWLFRIMGLVATKKPSDF